MKNKQAFSYKIAHYLLLTCLLLIGVGLLVLGASFSHPNAEDLSLVVKPRNIGLFPSIVDMLNTYDGRYFVNFLHGITPLTYGKLGAYKWIIGFGIIFPIISLSYFLNSIFEKVRLGKTILFSTLFMLVNFALTPSLPHLLYWMSSSFVYLFSWCFWMLWVASFLRYLKVVRLLKKDFYFFLSLLFLICSMGMNEMFLVLNIGTIALFCLYFLLQKSPNLHYTLPFALATLVMFLFFLSNNGIEHRYESLNEIRVEGHSFLSLKFLVKHLSVILFKWLTKGFLMILFLIWSMLFFRNEKENLKSLISIKHKWYYASGAFIITVLMLLAFYIPMGEENVLPFRIYTSFLLVFQLLLTLLVVSFYHIRLPAFISKINMNLSLLSALVLAFVMLSGFVFQNNIKTLAMEYTQGELSAFHHTMLKRYSIIENTKVSSSNCWKFAVLPAIDIKPKSIFSNPDIKPNKEEFYWNNAYEKYFEIDEIRLEGDTFFTQHYVKIAGNE